MTDVEHWLGERLKALKESEFSGIPHRQAPSACLKYAKLSHFAAPLASGIGQALLASPLDPAKARDVVVILFHGIGNDCTYPHWHWVEAFVKEGISVLSVDWDGHGCGGASYLDLQSASRSLPLLLQKLYSAPGSLAIDKGREGPRCFLMGHSTGAALALLAVTRADVARVVEGVIAVSPTIVAGSRNRAMREFLSYLRPGALVRDFLSKVPYYGMAGIVPPYGNFKRDKFPVRLRVGIDFPDHLRNFVLETFEQRRVLRQVKVPVLWLHGTSDRIVPMEPASKLMSEIPTALFCHMDNSSGHFMMAFSHQIPAYAAKFVETCTVQ